MHSDGRAGRIPVPGHSIQLGRPLLPLPYFIPLRSSFFLTDDDVDGRDKRLLEKIPISRFMPCFADFYFDTRSFPTRQQQQQLGRR